MEKIKQLQRLLRDAWLLAYDLEKESEDVQTKIIFSKMNGIINSLEVRLYEILEQESPMKAHIE